MSDIVSDAVTDLSPASGNVALFGANLYNASSLTSGSLEHSYAADAFLSFSVASTDLTMSLSHSLSAACERWAQRYQPSAGRFH